MRKGHWKLFKFFILWMVATAAIMAYNGTHALRAGELMVVTHSNGEVEVEDRPGYHFKTGTVMIVKKSLLKRTDKLGGTLYKGKTTVGEHFDLSSPNKNLVRIK